MMSLRRSVCALCLLGGLCASACGGSSLFRQDEYEEDVYLALDGTSTVYVNSARAALNALRATTSAATPAARFNPDAVRAYYPTADTHVARVSPFRRSS